MEKEELLLKLSEIEFAALDMQLYLDTHPNDKQGIKQYNTLINEAKILRSEYEKKDGPMFSYIDISNENNFSWVNEPWPWEKEFNPALKQYK